MTKRLTRLAMPLALLAAAACAHHTPQVALAPQPAPLDTARHAAPAATPAPRDTLAAGQSAQARADSVRAQVMRDSAASGAVAAPTGLSPAEDSVLLARIHFGFDTATLDSQAMALLAQKARLLRANDHLRVEIAGNADERGSEEYNLALGLRRAASAKAYLTALGVAGDQISIVSYGEERPVDASHDATAWARNRRDDFEPKKP